MSRERDELKKLLEDLIGANAKRTYDHYQTQDTGVLGDMRGIAQKTAVDGAFYENQLKTLGNYAIARLIGAGDVANDRIWNVNETDQMAVIAAQTLAKTPVFLDAILEMLLAKLAETQSEK